MLLLVITVTTEVLSLQAQHLKWERWELHRWPTRLPRETWSTTNRNIPPRATCSGACIIIPKGWAITRIGFARWGVVVYGQSVLARYRSSSHLWLWPPSRWKHQHTSSLFSRVVCLFYSPGKRRGKPSLPARVPQPGSSPKGRSCTRTRTCGTPRRIEAV